jgi:hypothetical protein
LVLRERTEKMRDEVMGFEREREDREDERKFLENT